MEKLSLNWKDFHANASKSFSLFRSESYLHDVTLMSEDYCEVSAHKLVLSASSEYFRNIFKKCKGTNTIVCLDGVNREELQNVMDYIYYGEIKIHKEKLDSFLLVAKKLKLDCEMDYKQAKEDAKSINHQEENSLTSKPKDEKPRDQRKAALNPDNINICAKKLKLDCEMDYKQAKEGTKSTNHQEENSLTSKPKDEKPKDEKRTDQRKVALNPDSIIIGDVVSLNWSDFDQKIPKYVTKAKDGKWKCTICGKAIVNKSILKRHVDACLSDKPFYNCPTCDESFRSRSALYKHKIIVH